MGKNTEVASQYSEIEAERFKNFKTWLRENKDREGSLKN
jgi:hypothetical protein